MHSNERHASGSTVSARYLLSIAVRFCVVVFTRPKAYWGSAHVIWETVAYTLCLSMLRLNSVIWYHVAAWGWIW